MKDYSSQHELYEYDMMRPLGDANSPKGRSRVSGLAVFIDTDEGITGISEGSPGARSNIHSTAETVLIGRDPRGVKGCGSGWWFSSSKAATRASSTTPYRPLTLPSGT